MLFRDEILSAVIQNIQIVIFVFSIFAVIVFANTIFRTYFNIKNLKEDFSWSKFKMGLWKMICIGTGTGLLSIAVTIIPYIPILNQYLLDKEISTESISFAMIIICYAKSILTYFKSSIDALTDILDNKIMDYIPETTESIGSIVIPNLENFKVENISTPTITKNNGDIIKF